MAQVTDVPLVRRAPAGHVIYRVGAPSICPEHRWCAYTGDEADRCPRCHASYTIGCWHECTGCREAFATETAYYDHLTGEWACLDPGAIGLVLIEQDGWTLWAVPKKAKNTD